MSKRGQIVFFFITRNMQTLSMNLLHVMIPMNMQCKVLIVVFHSINVSLFSMCIICLFNRSGH